MLLGAFLLLHSFLDTGDFIFQMRENFFFHSHCKLSH